MKILPDQNLSHRLCSKLRDIFSDIIRTKDISLQQASDEEVWLYAKKKSYAIVSKDSDFLEKAIIRGHSPKIIWIKSGNCTTDKIESSLRENQDLIKSFKSDREFSIFTIF